MPIGRLVTVVLVGALVTAACGDDDSSGTDGSTTSIVETTTSTTEGADPEDVTTTEPLVLADSWPGVTADTIRVGFVDIDLETLNEMGLFESNRGDPRLMVAALVGELNDRGGILGRRVEPFTEIVLPIDSVEAEAACLRLTEDSDVFAVLGQYAGPTTQVNGCFSDQGETITIGGNPTPEQLARARAPWLTTGMGSERRLRAAVELMHDEGLFGERLGVATAASGEEVTDDIVIPLLEELGYDVVEDVVQTADAGDRVALGTDWATFVERFRSENVDTVVLVGSDVGINGTNQLTLLGFEGQILLVDAVSTIGSIGGTAENPLEDLEGIIGTIGPSTEESWELDTTQECVDILEAADPSITVHRSDQVPDGETDWAPTLLGICSRLRLFELIALEAGADLTPETFLAAAERLGDIDLPANPFSSLAPGKPDASDSLRLAEFDASIDADGGAAPIGPLMRIDG